MRGNSKINKVTNVEHKGFIVDICYDEYMCSPRETSNIGTMLCFHKSLYLPKECSFFKSDDYNSWDELKDDIIKKMDVPAILPIYEYNHSGVSISTMKFNSTWDSCQVGFIFAVKEDVDKWFEWEEITEERRNKLKDFLLEEVEMYNKYLLGKVYRYEISYLGEVLRQENNLFEEPEFIVEKAKRKIDDYVKYLPWYDKGCS
ncbi:MAG: hypothetical protein ACOC5T_01040 [Elusimicrobiota bacterium]